MDCPESHDVTQVLIAWIDGDQAVAHRLMSVVYEELHRLARPYMRRESPGHALQTSALVNDAILRLVDQRNVHWQNRAYFRYRSADGRRILIDYTRSRSYAKRGGGNGRLTLDEGLIMSNERSAKVVAVSEALEELPKFDARTEQGMPGASYPQNANAVPGAASGLA